MDLWSERERRAWRDKHNAVSAALGAARIAQRVVGSKGERASEVDES